MMAKLSATYTATLQAQTSTVLTPLPQALPSQAIHCRGYQAGQGPMSPSSPLLLPCTLLLHFITPLPSWSLPKLSMCQPLCSPPPQQLLQLCPCSTRTTPIPFVSGQPSCLTNYTPKGPSCVCSAEPGVTHFPRAGLSLWQVRLQTPHFFICCCFSCALHLANSNTCLLRSHVKAFTKSSSERDRRPGLQKVLPCPDQQQDAVCWFPTGHRRQLFSECKSSKCCGWDRASSCQVPRLYSLKRALPCLP